MPYTYAVSAFFIHGNLDKKNKTQNINIVIFLSLLFLFSAFWHLYNFVFVFRIFCIITNKYDKWGSKCKSFREYKELKRVQQQQK